MPKRAGQAKQLTLTLTLTLALTLALTLPLGAAARLCGKAVDSRS